jgi:hypothetical protein
MYATVCAACLVFSIPVVQCIGTLLLYHYLLNFKGTCLQGWRVAYHVASSGVLAPRRSGLSSSSQLGPSLTVETERR